MGRPSRKATRQLLALDATQTSVSSVQLSLISRHHGAWRFLHVFVFLTWRRLTARADRVNSVQYVVDGVSADRFVSLTVPLVRLGALIVQGGEVPSEVPQSVLLLLPNGLARCLLHI